MKSRLHQLMLYDVFIFCVCLGLTALAAVFDASFWLYAFWARVAYGLFSFPWIPLALPLVDELIAHARATGYSTRGRCRIKSMKKPAQDEPDPDVRERATMLSRAVDSDTVLSEILNDMLDIAIRGGHLPIHHWSEQLAPVFQKSIDVVSDRKDRLRTAAERRGGGLQGWRAGAADVARDETATQAKVLLAKNADDLAQQVAVMINAALELPNFVAESVEDIVLSFVPDVTEELSEGIDEWLSAQESTAAPAVTDHSSAAGPVGCGARVRSWILYSWAPFDRRCTCCSAGNLLKAAACNSLLGTNYLVLLLLFAFMVPTNK
jgi:hypothetical protein